MISESLIRRLCIRLATATYSSALALYNECTYGDLIEWAEDVSAIQKPPSPDEAINVEAEIINSY
jgi:hypothetical protein